MSISTPAERIEPILTWIEENRDAAIADLQRFCRQPSISAQGQGMGEMAELVAGSLRELGAETSLVPTQGFPVVVGRLAGESTRRLAIYDHYDAQPPGPLEASAFSPGRSASTRSSALARPSSPSSTRAAVRPEPSRPLRPPSLPSRAAGEEPASRHEPAVDVPEQRRQ